ncbi:LOW QUALITY PROTEIN: hypothetical protein PoB_006896900 [Plakobranchus ocellatus]|uniref:Uncharacterized protein n=1 Tax=Plakobranchus ocellatus TaxID=259542 RepID=A0AAV4DEB5_9GAST|nr:LOW QUALITY PROTEIN: hypothetical protein PoB_006896900 [Plakobranchus ocellatus]
MVDPILHAIFFVRPNPDWRPALPDSMLHAISLSGPTQTGGNPDWRPALPDSMLHAISLSGPTQTGGPPCRIQCCTLFLCQAQPRLAARLAGFNAARYFSVRPNPDWRRTGGGKESQYSQTARFSTISYLPY